MTFWEFNYFRPQGGFSGNFALSVDTAMESQGTVGGGGGGAEGMHRMNRILGGAETVVDETGERMKEEFLNFLETYALRGLFVLLMMAC